MSGTIFREIGPYTIERQLGRGGMAQVFLAVDSRSSRTVALKVVPNGDDLDAREIVEAEQRGAELQTKFSEASQYVPKVYETGTAPGYFYIAMEYIDGEDLSSLISQGPLAPATAAGIAIQLCRFLEEVGRVKTSADGPSMQTLLHNDLKPTNVRVVAGDQIKVLDFGASKSLSLSRRVTRNDFGSIPYLSPECLESGERDRQTDAWSLGVLLYEMVDGAPPFQAADTRRLEDRIRSRQSPEPLAGAPVALQAVIAKLLAPYPQHRYEEAGAIRADLERVLAGASTTAESEGWPGRANDQAPTRRTRPPVTDQAPTRRTTTDARGATRPESSGAPPIAPAVDTPKTKPRRPVLRAVGIVALLLLVGNEACVATQAHRLAATVPAQEFSGLTDIWTEYENLAQQSWMRGAGVTELNHALRKQALVLADRVVDNYKSPAPTVREAQWAIVAEGLQRAVNVAPGDTVLRSELRYVEGHLHRINGEARKLRQQAAAQKEFNDALAAFREAAELRPRWPDPFLGLARTFIYGLDDIDRGADAMKQAEALGYKLGPRETAQLADGYRARGDSLEHAAEALAGMPQEHDILMRAADAYRRALDLYSQIANFADVPTEIRATQTRLEKVQHRLTEIVTPAEALWE